MSDQKLSGETVKALKGAAQLLGHVEKLLDQGEHDGMRIARLVKAAQDALAETHIELAMAAANSPSMNQWRREMAAALREEARRG